MRFLIITLLFLTACDRVEHGVIKPIKDAIALPADQQWKICADKSHNTMEAETCMNAAGWKHIAKNNTWQRME